MSQTINDYMVIAISSPSGVEKDLSSAINRSNDYQVIYVSTDLASKDIDKNAIFVLINPANDIKGIDNTVKKICSSKKVIFYLHNTDITKNAANLNGIVAAVKGYGCEVIAEIRFSHEPDTNSEFKPYKTFLECVKNTVKSNNFSPCLKELIRESQKKKDTPHLIALSILCQGYLAAHGGAGLDGWENKLKDLLVKDANKKTEDKDWWKPALGDNMKGEELIKELKAFNQDEAFIKLTKNEKENKDVIQYLTEYTDDNLEKLVIKIYKFLKDNIVSNKKQFSDEKR